MSPLIIHNYKYSDLDSVNLISELAEVDVINICVTSKQAKMLAKTWSKYDAYKLAYADRKPLLALVKSFFWMVVDIFVKLKYEELNNINELYYSIGKTVFPVHFEKKESGYIVWFCKRTNEKTKRFETIKLLAEVGSPEAECSLGMLYLEGEGVDVDYHQARDWLTKAADQRNTEAQYGLWWIYANGKGLERDDNKAMYWLKVAADNGHKKAKDVIARVNVSM